MNEKKVVLITGGSGGVGLALVHAFASQNYNVAFTYFKNEEKAKQTEKEILEKYNRKTLPLFCDVTKEESIKNIVQKVIQTYGKIDVLINNAGIDKTSFIEDKTKETFLEILDVNLIGPFLLSKTVAPFMLEQKKGCILNISSNNGISANSPFSLEYDASKAALNSLTINLSDAYAPYIRVNAIAPGWIDTDMNKCEDKDIEEEFQKEEIKKINVNRFATPEEIASLALFLASNQADYINREIIKIDGGFHG